MARQARIVVPGIPHNVCLRGNNRRRLFSSLPDRLRFVRCLEYGIKHSGCAIHQLTLMNNHVHLVVRPPTREALSCLVGRTCQQYAQRRNADRAASGKLFEERFYSAVIEDDAALMSVTLYNDANGHRAGLAAAAFGHEWSTGPLHAGVAGGRIPVRLWTPSAWYRALGVSPDARAAAYRELIAAYVSRAQVVESAHEQGGVGPRHDRYTLRLERPDRSLAREDFRGGLGKTR